MLVKLTSYVITAAFRDKLFLSFALLLAVGISLSIFMGSSAVTEKDQFALVFAASGLRMASVFGILLFVVFFVRRSFETRDVEYLLTRPISRFQYLLSHVMAFALIALVFAVLTAICIFVMGRESGFNSGYILWVFSFFAELVIIANVAFFFAMVLSSAVASVLITAAFYILSRLIGQILGIIDRHHYGDVFDFLEKIMLVVSMFIPRLDLMGQSGWLLYSVEQGAIGYGFVALQAVVFSCLVLSAAMIDLKRKQF
ncbi:MAG: hypothetical protein HRT94_02375 [Alphaproteobacteria bacterium]|nr:hypothetical protein [Alphaproteobacteria bacterium]